MSGSRARLVAALARPAAAGAAFLFAGVGTAAAGSAGAVRPLLTSVLVIVAAWFTALVCLNDLGDEAIDRVNLAGGYGRPLVTGEASRRQVALIGLGAAVLALAVGWLEAPSIAVVVALGLALGAAYSLPPFRLCGRGVVASAVLPAGYVAVPFLVGALAVDASPSFRTFAVLPGLYVVFMGRILLKDFRDLEGDALFGKRTFLVRHGRTATVLFSAGCWCVGAVAVAAAVPQRSMLLAPIAVLLACVLHGLSRVADDTAPGSPVVTDTAIAGIAQTGRGLGVMLLGHLTMLEQGWHAWPQLGLTVAMTVLFVAAYADIAMASSANRSWWWSAVPSRCSLASARRSQR
jgi:4-hydroxybenzoate polyprenyltransferase